MKLFIVKNMTYRKNEVFENEPDALIESQKSERGPVVEREIADIGDNQLPQNNEEERAAIRHAVKYYLMRELENQITWDISWSDRIVQRGDEFFAVFGEKAYPCPPRHIVEARDEPGHTQLEFLPVLVDGRAIKVIPEVGSGGLIYLRRFVKKNNIAHVSRWHHSLYDRGWLYERELELTYQELREIRLAENEKKIESLPFFLGGNT